MILLKEFYAYGFKSYAEPTTIKFNTDFVGVVGPNGSGKSNIVDGVRWVLGEQSKKTLRGQNNDDFIFSGSKSKVALDVAEVSLTFDNSGKYLNYPSKKLVITRRVTRGQPGSEYFANNEKIQLKKIHDIFINLGLNKNGLGIISQGTVQNFASAKPESRKSFFEEIAKVSQYKVRKQEASSKLAKTSSNLQRINDIVFEINRNVTKLKKQVAKAEEYKTKSQKLRDYEVTSIVDDYREFGEINLKKAEALTAAVRSRNENAENLENVKRQVNANQNYLKEINSRITEYQEKLSQIIGVTDQLQSQKARDNEKSAKSYTSTEMLEQEIMEIRSKLSVDEESLAKATTNLEEKKNIYSVLTIDKNVAFEKFQKLRREETELKTRSDFLQEIQISGKHLKEGVRNLLKNKNALPGIENVISNLVRTENAHQKAIEVALGPALQNIVAENDEIAKKAILFLKKNQSGIATVIPRKNIRPKKIKQEDWMVVSELPGFIGIASELVNVDKKYAPVFDFLLGSTLVVENLDSGSEINKIFEGRYRIITLDGQKINIGGSFTGGHIRHNSLLNSHSELEEYRRKTELVTRELEKLKTFLSEIDIRINDAQLAINTQVANVAKIEESIRLQQEILMDKETDYQKLTSKSISGLARLSGAELIEQIHSLQKEKLGQKELLNGVEDSRQLLLEKMYNLENEQKTLTASWENDIQKITNLKLEIGKIETFLQQRSEYLSSEYGMTIEFALENWKTKIPKKGIRERNQIIRSLKDDLKKIGPVNLNVIAEYEEEFSRYTTISKQYKELKQAEADLIAAIENMDLVMVEKLVDTLDKINFELAIVMKNLFGGGNAKLDFSNPDEILDSGIEIIVNPPGKIVTNINLLSGGEKTLTVLAVLFAILKVSSLPLIMLDEAESQLDVANVERFAKYLLTLKNKTQFIVITHRPGTMEYCDELYGCTMQTKGVTNILLVKLQEALANFSEDE